MERYGVAPDRKSGRADSFESDADPLYDTVEVVVAFYLDEEGEVGKMMFTGDTLLFDMPKYFYRRDEEGNPILSEELFVDGKTVTASVIAPNRFPIVVRRNTASTPGLYGGSDCEKIRPQQQAINKIESRILKKLLRAGVTPVMPEDSSVSLSNAVFGQVIKMRPGESIDSYGKIDTTPDVTQDIKEADRLYNMARRILGISDSITGNEIPVQTSGVAMQLNIARGISRLESKRRLKYAAYAELYRIISGYFLSFYDGRRELCSRDAEGCLHTSVFTRGDFVEGSDGCYHLCPDYIFTVDLNFGGEYTKEALWERNLQNLKAGTLGDPCDARTLLRYWQFQESASYPYARENVKYFKSIIENERKEK
jgi:hypothetical protein